MVEPVESTGSERLWQNGWGMTVARLQIAGEQLEGFRIWFEGPRHGWLFFHLDLIGMGEFVCRASCVPNDFLGELVAALCGILKREQVTVAAAHGEPDSFEFRFTRPPDAKEVRLELVGFPSFERRESAKGEPLLALGPNGDAVCRAFCFGLRELQSQLSADAYQAEMQVAFPSAGIAELSELLGGEFSSETTGLG